MFGRCTQLATRFTRNPSGNVAIIFALVFVPIAGITASAIDYGRASQVRRQIQNATDAAAEQASRMLAAPNDQIETTIRAHLQLNMPADLRSLAFTMAIPADRSTVSIAMETKVPTSLMAIIGYEALEVKTTSLARRPEVPIIAPVSPTVPVGDPGGQRTAVRQLIPPGADLPPELRRAIEEQLRLLEQLSAEASRSGQPPDLARLLRERGRR